jgi:tetratricopeptide (TPR) repeat protein
MRGRSNVGDVDDKGNFQVIEKDYKPIVPEDVQAAGSGSVYHVQPTRSAHRVYPPRGRAQPPSEKTKRDKNLGHAILIAHIRTFTLVTLFMFGLLGVAVYVTGRAWQKHMERARASSAAPRPVAEEAVPVVLDTGVLVTDAEDEEPARLRVELDTDALRRAVFLQQQAEQMLEEGRRQEALALFVEALEWWPNLTAVWGTVGQLYLEERDFERAEEALERAVEADPGNPERLNDLGVALLYQNRLDEALEVFGAVLEISPAYAPAHFNLALCHLARNDDAAAEAELDAFLVLRPDDPQALKEKAYLLAVRGAHDEALPLLDTAIEGAPDWPPLYVDAAAVAALMGQLDQAIHYLSGLEERTSAVTVQRVYHQPAFRTIRLTDEGQQFERKLAERARSRLGSSRDVPTESAAATLPMRSLVER